MMGRIVTYSGVTFVLVLVSTLFFGAGPVLAQYGCDVYEVGTNYSETICPTSSGASDTTTTDSAEAQDITNPTSADEDILLIETEITPRQSSRWGLAWLITILIIVSGLGLWWLIAFWRRRKDDEDQHKPTP